MQNIQTQQMEIYASSRPIQGTVSTKAREFIMTPESVENVQENTLMQPSQLPGNIEFQIKGHLDSVAFCLDDPLTGSSKLIAKNAQTQYKASLKLIQGVPTSLGYVPFFTNMYFRSVKFFSSHFLQTAKKQCLLLCNCFHIY